MKFKPSNLFSLGAVAVALLGMYFESKAQEQEMAELKQELITELKGGHENDKHKNRQRNI